MTSRRSRAREVALQLLFQHDRNSRPVPRAAAEAFARDRLAGDAEAVAFAFALFDGVLANRAAIDDRVATTAENWRLTRMMPVDRNVLRLGTYELTFAPDPTPVAVAVDEAVELARRYGSAESPAFVNGILDRIAKMRNAELGMRNENPSPEPAS
jgi:N utilization substance protein B